jgi:hypothetical protein
MSPIEYDRFTERVSDRLAADERVLALVALGSTAVPELRDGHSDHDFWLVVSAGAKAAYLEENSWLPNAALIVAAVRQGAHYCTILDQTGHVVEFGVFEVSELPSGRLGRYSVLFDRHGIAAELTEIAGWSPSRRARLDDRPECELLLITLLTGARRAARGERLSAHRYLVSFALDILLGLLRRREESSPLQWSDPLDPWRRFEQVNPPLASELRSAVRLPEARAAARLLEIAERELGQGTTDFPVETAEAVRLALGHLYIREDEGGSRGVR